MNRSTKSEESKHTNDHNDAMEQTKGQEWGRGMGVGRREGGRKGVGRWIWKGMQVGGGKQGEVGRGQQVGWRKGKEKNP